MRVETVVVGAGVAGLATAWRLAERGHPVVAFEQYRIGHDRGSSHGPSRVFRFAYEDPLYTAMAQAALPMWRELDPELLRPTGGVDVGTPGRLEKIAGALTTCGAACELVDGAARRERFGWLSGESPVLWSPDTGVLAAHRALTTLASRARAAGAEIREGCAVCAIEPTADGAVLLDTDAGPLTASRCIVTAGAWVGPVLSAIGLTVPVRVTREQVFYFRAHAEPAVAIDWESNCYVVPPAVPGHPVKVAEHMTGAETSADARSFDPDDAGRRRVVDFVRANLPTLEPEPVGFETCLYTVTPDEDFVIDRRGPIMVASACSGHGFKFGPLTGEVLACLSTDREPPVDISRFSMERLAT